MSSYFNLILDTLAPASPAILIAGGAAYTSAQLVTCGISTADGDVVVDRQIFTTQFMIVAG